MSDTSRQGDWTKPAAMAIPKGGYFKDKVEQGRYGPIFPKLRRVMASRSLRKLFPEGKKPSTIMLNSWRRQSQTSPTYSLYSRLHYLRWVLFTIKGETYFMYQGIFDTDFDKYTEDAVALFGSTGISTVFENLEGWPADWQRILRPSSSSSATTNVQAFSNTASIPT